MKKIISLFLCVLIMLTCIFSLVGCSKEEHEHTSKKWEKDKNQHWRVCDGCNAMLSKEEHDFIESTDGYSITQICKVCEYSYVSKKSPVHTHTYGESYSYNEDNHYYACTYEDCTTHKGVERHSFDSPTVTEEGGRTLRAYSCRACDYKVSESTDREYKVMSANILGKYDYHADEDADTQARMQTFAKYIVDNGIDSVGIQEYGSRNKLFLPQYLPEYYAFVDFGQEWIPTLYNSEKLTVEKAVSKKLTTTSGQNYCFTMAVFANKDDGSLAYIHGNLHLEYDSKDTRITNSKEVSKAINTLMAGDARYKQIPLVITGDYNATLKTEPSVFWNIAGIYNIKDAPEVAYEHEEGQATYHHKPGNAVGEGEAIDHILVLDDTTVVYSHGIIKEDDCPEILNASDHYPVVIQFAPREKK